MVLSFFNFFKETFLFLFHMSLSFKLSFVLVKTYHFDTTKYLWETKGKSDGPLNQQNQTRLFNIIQREQFDSFYFLHHELVY